MRRSTLVIAVPLAIALMHRASAAPTIVGRVALVASGDLTPDALADGVPDGRALVTVQVPGGADRLRHVGFDAQPLSTTIAALRVTADELRRLLALPDVVTVEERRIAHPLLDVSAAAVGAPVARAETGLDGTGSLVAVIDTGIDFRHADFRHADGTTRVAALLDLSLQRGDLHPEIADYEGGAVWLRDDIDATLAAEAAGVTLTAPVGERDVNGHGTHVIGIAASNGRATGHGFVAGRYVGIAPGADIIAVQATHGGDSAFSDADVITGCRFAVDMAAMLARPVAVNLSLGSNAGPHDGTSDFEVALDEMFPADEPGRALVVASGNEGSRDQHAGAWALDGDVSIPLDMSSSSQAQARLSVEMWHDGALSIAVTSPAGHTVGPVPAGLMLTGPVTSEGQILITNGALDPMRPDGRSTATVAIEGPAGGAPADGRWTILLAGRATRWDAWISDEPAAATPAHFVEQIAVDDRIDIPATARNAIVVGSFVSRNQWTNVDGTTIMRSQVVGAPSTFSSAGPTADGRFAPDVVAPGEYIVSSMSADATPDDPMSVFFVAPHNHLTWGDDGVHGILRGTSQAAPHVTGAIALLHQADATLTAGDVREILRTTARDDAAGYGPKRGFGALDVLAALRYVRGARGSVVSATASSIGLSRDVVPPGESTTTVTVTPRADDGTPLGPGHAVTITATAGAPVEDVVDVGRGRYERAFVAHAPRGTTAIVTASVDGVTLAAHPSIYIVDARSDIGAPFAAEGGCAFASRSVATRTIVPIILLAVFAAGSVRRRRRPL